MNNVTKQVVIDITIQIVNEVGAIKATDLATRIIGQTLNLEFKAKEYLELLDELVVDGKLREVQYIHFAIPDRLKSVYFPAGTYIQVMPAFIASEK